MSVPSHTRYSPLDRESVHADMRRDPRGTRRAMSVQPGVLAAHRDCPVCAELDPVRAHDRVHQAQVLLSMPELAAALGLPGDARPVRMFVTDDPPLLHLVIESDQLPPTPAAEPLPIADLR